ncbi:DUF2194 domain-containing protein [Pontibacillus salicampi]|uniref:DUF2194 domain-containing protein n=1 Tax=Pontibacillus salicampi TaxID=1449801 RepID=A0ABV6LQF3_9BACI
MNKPILLRISGLFLVLLSIIVLLQLWRMDYFQQVFTPIQEKEKAFPTSQSSKEKTPGKKVQVFIHKNESDLSQNTLSNLEHALQYGKVDYSIINKQEISSINPSPYHVLVLAGEHTDNWPFEDIQSFVNNGGRLFIGARFIDERWNDLLGIKQVGDYKDRIQGLTFEKELFPGYVNLESNSTLFTHSIADVTLNEEANLYISTMNKPIMWTNQPGKGKVVYWNTTSLTEKSSRGLLLHSLGLLPPTFVSGQAGIKAMHIDDFPAPVPSETNSIIEEQYNTSVKQFYTDIWWEDMKHLGREYDVNYTGFMIGTYRKDTVLDSEALKDRIRYPMLYFGRELVKENGEIGLHGYNHQSLVTAEETIDPSFGYRPWQSKSEMVDSINVVKDTFAYYFPNREMESYVPPSNVLNRTGVEALSDTLPHLQVVAALYSGSKENGSFIQEFTYDETFEHIYHFPRISSGYDLTTEEQFVISDAAANFGVVSHFIHPDDVLDPYRSKGEDWESMRDGYEDMLQHIASHYPHLEGLTQYHAYQKMDAYQKSKITVTRDDNTLHISGEELLQPSTLFVRVNEDSALETGTFSFGEVSQYGKGASLYRVTLTSGNAALPIKDGSS